MLKIAVIFALTLGAVLAQAQENNENQYEDNLINTLHYRNPKHGFYTSLNLSTSVYRTEDIYSGGAKTDHYSRNSLASTLDFAYGITDAWQVGLSENYLISYNSTDSAINGSSSYSSSGASDPTLQVSYRFKGGLTGREFGTVYLNVTPTLGSEQNATASKNGNNLAANTSVALGANFYWVSGVHELNLNPFLTYHTSGTYYNTSSSYTNDDYLLYGAGGTYRYHINDRWAVSGNVILTPPYGTTFNNSNNTQTASYAFQVSESVSLNWKPVPTCVFAASLSNSESNTLSTFNTGANADMSNVQQNYFTITAAHVY